MQNLLDDTRRDARGRIRLFQRIRSVHRSNGSSVPRTTPEKVVPKRTACQHGGRCFADERKDAPKSMEMDMRPSSEAPPYSPLDVDVTVWVMDVARDGDVDACRCGAWTGLGWYNGAGVPTWVFIPPESERSKGELGGPICMGSMPWWMPWTLPGGGDGDPWPH